MFDFLARQHQSASKARKLITLIASTPDCELSAKLPILLRAFLLPLLSFASTAYRASVLARASFYQWGVFQKQELPVPVISVGNLTWGGNGKTPMVEYLARFFVEMGLPPLILTRAYRGGDESKMLHRHLSDTTTKIGIGANRFVAATSFIKTHGCMDISEIQSIGRGSSYKSGFSSTKIGVAVLDDGMQHWSLSRDVDVVMVNGILPWGNSHLLPRGSLRESLDAFRRVDIAVIHHADLASSEQLEVIESVIRHVRQLPIFFTMLAPLYFFDVQDCSKFPLRLVHQKVVVCVSAIGSPESFVQAIEKLKPCYVDRIDFDDHHYIQASDSEMIKGKLKCLEKEYGMKPIVTVTEKDYDRDSDILRELSNTVSVFVLHSSLQFLSNGGRSEETFKELLKELVVSKTRRWPAKCTG